MAATAGASDAARADDGARPSDAPLDVLTAGMVFLDIVFTGLPIGPTPGVEVWTEGMGSSPGGIANLAVAAARLGLRTGLAAAFSEDGYGHWCRRVLGHDERIDLGLSRSYPGWHTPVTVSLAYGGDRAMVTHGHPEPEPLATLLAKPPATRAVLADLAPSDTEPWWRASQRDGALVFLDVGWDPAEAWDPTLLDLLDGCHAFLPNQVEACAYTRTDSAMSACAALAERVPLAIVTCGADGACAIDAGSGECVSVPAVPVEAIDPTGAGDVFGAAIVRGTLSGWPLRQRLLFAALCSSLAVQQFGGSLAAPGWGDISDWYRRQLDLARTGDESAGRVAHAYGFLADLLPTCRIGRVRRAEATIAAWSDLPPAPEALAGP